MPISNIQNSGRTTAVTAWSHRHFHPVTWSPWNFSILSCGPARAWPRIPRESEKAHISCTRACGKPLSEKSDHNSGIFWLMLPCFVGSPVKSDLLADLCENTMRSVDSKHLLQQKEFPSVALKRLKKQKEPKKSRLPGWPHFGWAKLFSTWEPLSSSIDITKHNKT